MSAPRVLALCVLLAVCSVALADVSILDEELAPPPTSAQKLAALRLRGGSSASAFVESSQRSSAGARELPFPLPDRAENRDNHLPWLLRESSFNTNTALENTIDDYPRRPIIAKLRDGFRNKIRKQHWRPTGAQGETHFWPIKYSGRWEPLKATRAEGRRILREFKLTDRLKDAPPVEKPFLRYIAQTMSDAEHFRGEYHEDADHHKDVKLLGFD